LSVCNAKLLDDLSLKHQKL